METAATATTPTRVSHRSSYTPPRTPVAPTSASDCGLAATPPHDRLAVARHNALFEAPPRPCGAYAEHIQPGSTRVLLGRGAWSEVVRGTLNYGSEKNIVVAIKKPCNPGGREILREEAKILSYIASSSPKESIVRFLGFDPSTAAILMDCVAGTTLGQYCRRRRAERVATHRSDPVVGLPEWLRIASQLADSFVHLKRIGVVHGDVTWNNVLMKETQTRSGPCNIPVIIDFSSGHLKVDGCEPAAVSATTTAFCSPELLEAHLRGPITPPHSPTDENSVQDSGPRPVATHASDLYGLAMTLLSAAIGAEVYENVELRYEGIYARQGDPLNWVRNGDACMIVGVRSVVSRTLGGCFGRVAEKRVEVEQLRDRIVGQMDGLA